MTSTEIADVVAWLAAQRVRFVGPALHLSPVTIRRKL